jgi:hypothetical protein
VSGFSTLMDDATAKHLDAWLVRMVPEHLRDATLDLILGALDDYPDLIEKGRSWTEIREVGERIQGRKAA